MLAFRGGVSGAARHWRSRDRGSGGVLALAVVASMLAFSLLALSIFAAFPARARLHGAADSAALAAAEAASGRVAGYPCELAVEAAAVNGATLSKCEVSLGHATVTVTRGILGVAVEATSRAGPPAGTATGANGELSIAQLHVVDYPGVRHDPPVMLRGDAALALLALLTAYHEQTGDYLPVDEGYRDLATQEQLWRLHGPPRAAVPGTSNHGWGIAVDFTTPPVDHGSAEHAWLVLHASEYGFSPLTDPDEPWHWDFIG